MTAKNRNNAGTLLFTCFMFLQYVILRLGNQAGRGYLLEARQELVYYALQLFAILGFLAHALLRRMALYRLTLRAVPGLCAAGTTYLLFFPTGSALYLAVTGLTVLCLGVTGGAVYLRMAALSAKGAKTGLSLGVGCGTALALQYVLQLRWTVLPLLCAASLAAFLALWLLLQREQEPSPPAREQAQGRTPLFAAVIALAMLLFTSYYTGYIHHLQIESGYREFNVYSWPRLLMIPGLLLFGLLGDLRQGRALPLAALCVVVLALLNAVLAGSGGSYWVNMCLYYIALSAPIAYYNLTFWRLAPGTKRPALWAPMGRILDSCVVLLAWLTGLSSLTPTAMLAVDVALLAVTIVLMALNGDLALRAPTPQRAAPAQTAPPPEDAFPLLQQRFGLTQSELRVLRELVLTEDKQNAVADRLGVKLRTVQASVTAIYRKTGASTRSGLVQLYHDAAQGK